jgi:hypothetical protein
VVGEGNGWPHVCMFMFIFMFMFMISSHIICTWETHMQDAPVWRKGSIRKEKKRKEKKKRRKENVIGIFYF